MVCKRMLLICSPQVKEFINLCHRHLVPSKQKSNEVQSLNGSQLSGSELTPSGAIYGGGNVWGGRSLPLMSHGVPIEKINKQCEVQVYKTDWPSRIGWYNLYAPHVALCSASSWLSLPTILLKFASSNGGDSDGGAAWFVAGGWAATWCWLMPDKVENPHQQITVVPCEHA